MRQILVSMMVLAGAGLLAGCTKPLEEQTKKTGSVVGKETQEIGKFDPNANQQVSDSKINANQGVASPVTAPLAAYGPMLEKLAKTEIAHAINLFQAEHGRFPKDYDEFMSQIIKKNKIKLPVLPNNKVYQYDEANHQLVVVDAPADQPKN